MKNNLSKLFFAALAALTLAAAPAFATDTPDTDADTGDTVTYDTPANPEPEMPDGDTREEEAQPDAAQTAGILPLGTVIRSAWPRFSDGNPVIKKIDLEKKMSDPSISGESAAALAVLVKLLHKKDDLPLTLDTALELVSGDKTETNFKRTAVKLRNANRALFAKGLPDFDKMQQGHATDCYFLSGTGWIAKYRPEVIANAITKEADTYTVKFPSGERASFAAPTDAEIALNDSSSTLTDGIWMTVLAKAEGIIEARTNARRAAIADPNMRVDVGGGPLAIVKRWTGKKPISFHLGEDAKTARIRKALIRMDEKRLMAEVFAKKASGHIAGNHCYAIFGFNADTDMVTVWNPWGDNFTPKGPDGPKYGYARRHGIFQIPLKEFIKRFYFMSIEKE